MKDKTNLVLIGLVLVAVALAGVLGTKIKKQQESLLEPKEAPTPQVASQQSSSPEVSYDFPKSDKPEVKFFVMSFCPYGNQAEAGLEPVYQLLKNKVDWQPRYIVSDKKASCEQSCNYRVWNEQAKQTCQAAISQGRVKDMEECQKYYPYSSVEECTKNLCRGIKAGEWESLHGDQELNQDVREICAFNLGDLDKWWQFVLAVNDNCNQNNADSCWQTWAEKAGLDKEKISACALRQKEQLLKNQLNESQKFQAYGSPTVFINEVLYKGGRAPEDYKKAICSAFKNPPSECQTVLGQETAAPASGGCQ